MSSIFGRQPIELFVGKYHKYRIANDEGTLIKNPAFDKYSGFILDIKSDKELDRRVLEFFSNSLVKVIQAGNQVGINLAAIVPSHSKDGYSKNLNEVLKLSAKQLGFQVEPRLMWRTKTIDKLASGGDRSQSVHTSSIVVRLPEIVRNQKVLLVDDVWTTGNSMRACASLLYEKGATSVVTVAFGKTALE